MLLFAAMIPPAVYASGESISWETMTGTTVEAKSVAKESGIEILAAPSCIIVNSPRQVQIKVFSILGRLVSSETLQPGSSRLRIAAHGVYIVKAGEITCKVAI